MIDIYINFTFHVFIIIKSVDEMSVFNDFCVC